MDFHNRQYDPQLGRFLSIDPLAAATVTVSPYAAMDNNPVSMVDPLGLSPRDPNHMEANTPYLYRPHTPYGSVALTNKGHYDDLSFTFDEEFFQGMDEHAASYNEAAVGDGEGPTSSTTQGDGDKKGETKSAASNIVDGFVGGLQSTYDGLKSLFTIEGFVSSALNTMPTVKLLNLSDQFHQDAELVKKIPTLTAADYQYGFGFALEKVAEAVVLKKATRAASFKLNNGWGLFGEKGLNVRGYKVNALYQDGQGGGTFFSLKQNVKGGNLLRWDRGTVEGGYGQSNAHSHFRFNIGGNTYGSTAQYPWYAPFTFWKYKK